MRRDQLGRFGCVLVRGFVGEQRPCGEVAPPPISATSTSQNAARWARRWPSALEFCTCYNSATIWATALSAPTLVARTHSVPSVLMVAPTTALPGILLSVFQQLVGINVVSSYSTSLWRSVGLPKSDSLTITRLTSVTNVLVTLIGVESHEVDGGDGLGLHIPAD